MCSRKEEKLYITAFLELFESGYAPHVGDVERIANKRVRKLFITLPHNYCSLLKSETREKSRGKKESLILFLSKTKLYLFLIIPIILLVLFIILLIAIYKQEMLLRS